MAKLVIDSKSKAPLTSMALLQLCVYGLPLLGPSFVFQKDNEPQSHTSRLCKSYLTKQESDGVLRQMSRPAQSLSRNPSEMARDEMDHRVEETQPKSAQNP